MLKSVALYKMSRLAVCWMGLPEIVSVLSFRGEALSQASGSSRACWGARWRLDFLQQLSSRLLDCFDWSRTADVRCSAVDDGEKPFVMRKRCDVSG